MNSSDTGPSTRGPGRPPVTTLAEVVQAAYDVYMEGGYAGLTISRVGERLGRNKSIVYNYVASKEELVAHVVDLINARIDLPSTDGEPREELRRTFTAIRAAQMAHPAVPLEGLVPPRAARLALIEAIFAVLRGAGLTPPEAELAYVTLSDLTLGNSVVDRLLDPAIETRLHLLRHADIAGYPNTVWATSGEAIRRDEVFDLQLGVVLDHFLR